MAAIEAPREGDQETYPIEAKRVDSVAVRAVEIAFTAAEVVDSDDSAADITEADLVLVTPPAAQEVVTISPVESPVIVERPPVEEKSRVVATAPVEAQVVPSQLLMPITTAEPSIEVPQMPEPESALTKEPTPEQSADKHEATPRHAEILEHEATATRDDAAVSPEANEGVSREAPEKARLKVQEPGPKAETAPNESEVESRPEDEPEDKLEVVDPTMYLAHLCQELQECRPTPDVAGPAFENAFYTIHDTVHELMDMGILNLPSEGDCEFEFTQRVLQLVEMEGRVAPYKEDLLDCVACVEAELRLMRSLEFDESGREKEKSFGSVILLDADGEPYAYEKASGIRTAYAWREAAAPTQHGVKWVPKDCFLDIQYSLGGESVDFIPGTQLVAPTHLNVENVEFLRFSNAGLPLEVREKAAMLGTGSTNNDKLRDNMVDAVSFTPHQVGERVCRLLG